MSYFIKAFIIVLIFNTSLFSQSIDEIKNNREVYIWGEGTGVTLREADKEALALLISQITTTVNSSTELKTNSKTVNGNELFTESINSIISTYSGATLKNTERLIISNEPEAKVFRYIKRSEISKVFEQRKHKILSFVDNADDRLENLKIADALRYYYWSLILLKSHPYNDEIFHIDDDGDKVLLSAWLLMRINDIFSDINIVVSNIEENESYDTYTLYVTYKNKAVDNFDFSYWTGSDWSNISSASDGIGVLELYGISKGADNLKIKAEYLFEGETKIDREVEDVFSKVSHITFKKSYYNISATKVSKRHLEEQEHEKIDDFITVIKDDSAYKDIINEVLKAITNNEISNVKHYFSAEGFSDFNKLINYGNAKVIKHDDMHFISFNDKVICRSIPMNFSFKNNFKNFVENVVFQFNKDKKIESVTFALSKTALDDIIKKTVWSEYDRMIIINFLESYKTAYALKKIDYIESVFADDALIITGRVVKVNPIENNKYKNNTIIKYNKQTKANYIRNLKYQFNYKEYINIKFEESKIRKAGKIDGLYGIEIKQIYFSSNYGDVGYLFLMLDLKDPTQPKIEVRTWQPEIDISKGDALYNLSDF